MALSRRDRMTLAVGGCVLVVFLLVQFAVFPLLDKRKRLHRTIAAREKAVVSLREMQAQYGQLDEKSNSVEKQLAGRSPAFSLFSFLEKMATNSRIKEHIAYMKPSTITGEGELRQVMVEMKLQAIGLRQLVIFLSRIEAPEKVVALKRISIQENKKVKGTLDVIMQVISIDQRKTNNEAG